MTRRLVPPATALALALASLSAEDAGAQAPNPSARPIRRVRVTVVTNDDRGRVFCAMWRGEEGYPTVRRRATHEGLDRTIEGRTATITFEAVPVGEYAVACFHDENDNNDLDTGLFGIPTEGTGASRGARGTMGPPPYEDARFRVDQRLRHHLVVRIVY